MVASCTPCVVSSTVSWSGQRVVAMRRRRSARASSEALKWNGRIALVSAACATLAGRTFKAPAAAEAARTSRRVGYDDGCDMDRLQSFRAPRIMAIEMGERTAGSSDDLTHKPLRRNRRLTLSFVENASAYTNEGRLRLLRQVLLHWGYATHSVQERHRQSGD